MNQQDKDNLIKEFTEYVCSTSLSVFNALELKTHIETMVVDQNTGDSYVLTFKKVIDGKIFDNSKDSFLYTKWGVNEKIQDDRRKIMALAKTNNVGFTISMHDINNLPIDFGE